MQRKNGTCNKKFWIKVKNFIESFKSTEAKISAIE